MKTAQPLCGNVQRSAWHIALARCKSGMHAANAPPALVHSDLAYRALLRNLGLLAGMRGGRTSFNVIIAGIGASSVAARLRALEPALQLDVIGGNGVVDVGALQATCGREQNIPFSCWSSCSSRGHAVL